MKLLYDSHIFESQRAGGVSRYYYELFNGLNRSDNDVKLAGLFAKNSYLLSNKQYRTSFVYDPTAIFAAINKMLIKSAIKRLETNRIFHPSDAHDFLKKQLPSVKNLIFTIHDMMVEKQDIRLGDDKLFYAKHARKIIAVSETTKKDIIKLFNIEADKIEVVYHGSSLNPQIATKLKQFVPDKYLLYVGDRYGHKNFTTFISAIAPLLRQQTDLFLVCAGKRDFSNNEKQLIDDLHIKDKVFLHKRLKDSELTYLYCQAQAFVFPSLAEGFGIPILEAWACGTPVVLSNIDCFREIAAEAGCYFDPYSSESICENVGKVLFNKQLQADLVRKGNSRLTLFSWENSIKKHLKVYQSLL